MRIDFECSGGYAGLRLSYTVDTNTIESELAAELEGAVKRSGMFNNSGAQDESTIRLSEEPRGGPPDVMTYRLIVDDEGRRSSATLTDVTAPTSLRPLLSRLRKLAIEKPG
jgi:hypothetical protein